MNTDFWSTLMKGAAGGAMPGGSWPFSSAALTPPISVEEYQKKIQELETVEQWMSMNLKMLQMSIQALKHQKTVAELMHNLPKAYSDTAQTFTETLNKNFSTHKESINPAESDASPESPEEEPKKTRSARTKRAQKNADSSGAKPNTNPDLSAALAPWQNLMQQFTVAIHESLQRSAPHTEEKATTKPTKPSPQKPTEKQTRKKSHPTGAGR